MAYSDFFYQATREFQPFLFQQTFAGANDLPLLVNVPTGLGKTAMAVLGWLWRRQFTSQTVRNVTPRRLVYCLPMRVLVEQTRENAIRWLHNLGRLGGNVVFDPPLNPGEHATANHRVNTYTPCADDSSKIAVHILMGGEDENEWDLRPERDAIIIGTQDMLLSRALNRGYAATRSRWPMQFGLLNTDCLWVFDEIQLMGSGLATTTQLAAFHRQLVGKDGTKNNGCKSMWMSATLDEKWLETVDFKDILKNLPSEAQITFDYEREIKDAILPEHVQKMLEDRWNAKKPLEKSRAPIEKMSELAQEIIDAHKPNTRTIIVMNTVKRARELHAKIAKQWDSANTKCLVLLHSHFRPGDRQQRVKEALAEPPKAGTIIVSTQVIEAGVDVNATTLFTELAPWASLIQRFGRCNRRGEQNDQASVHWINVPDEDTAPYELEDLEKAREQLEKLKDVGLKSLSKHPMEIPYRHTHVIRKRDLIDLFDTTPDLAGNDIDIDRFVREIEDSDVRVFWREWDMNKRKAPPDKKVWRHVRRDELCPAPIGDFKKFANAKRVKGKIWRWDFLDGQWQRIENKDGIYPGQTYLIHVSAGGYDPERGWTGLTGKAAVDVLNNVEPKELFDDANDDEGFSKTGYWQTIAEHTDDVCRELKRILEALPLTDQEAAALRIAARWHDLGKAHDIFQKILPESTPRKGELWAKASGNWKRYRDVGRSHFRHELASALAVLQRPHETLRGLSNFDLNLVAYLIAAHHGKVRLSIRSLPNETRPHKDGKRLDNCRFARGIWEIDSLPETNLGSDNGSPIISPEVKQLSLEPMELGLGEGTPVECFKNQPSWVERMIDLRDKLGPFRLAYLEAILRAADMRASRAAEDAQHAICETTPTETIHG